MLKFHQDGSNEVFYATKNSAGFDLFAQHELVIEPGCWALVNTGLKIVESSKGESVRLGQFEVTILPELQIRPRSGLAAKFGITVLNSPSTIDADYRGEIKVTLINHSQKKFIVCAGDRIAQGICSLVFHAPGVSVQDVERGTNGFGSTGGVTHST